MLERLPCLYACATLTTDRETDRQVGWGGVRLTLSPSCDCTTPDGGRYIFHQLLLSTYKLAVLEILP